MKRQILFAFIMVMLLCGGTLPHQEKTSPHKGKDSPMEEM
jgi:hypothetical protein